MMAQQLLFMLEEEWFGRTAYKVLFNGQVIMGSATRQDIRLQGGY